MLLLYSVRGVQLLVLLPCRGPHNPVGVQLARLVVIFASRCYLRNICFSFWYLGRPDWIAPHEKHFVALMFSFAHISRIMLVVEPSNTDSGNRFFWGARCPSMTRLFSATEVCSMIWYLSDATRPWLYFDVTASSVELMGKTSCVLFATRHRLCG